MTRILVTGGRGILGSQIASLLSEQGYTVRITSRSASRLAPGSKQEWAQADMETGDGLREALQGVDVIVHCATNAMKHSYQVEVEGTKRLLDLAEAEGVKHLLYISIVGIEKVPFFYYKHKLAAEELIKAGNVPWTILRATQFHEFIDLLLNGAKRLPVMPLPTAWQFQPIDSGEVAQHMVSLVKAGPSGHVADIAGPEVLRLGEMAKVWKRAQGIRRPVLPLNLPGKFMAAYRKGYNTAPQSRFGKITWGEWVRRKYGTQPSASRKPGKVTA